MQGYLDDPDQTAAAIDTEGWLHTGDIGVMDERGYLDIVDRMKDMFIVGGFNAYPAEIEHALLEHDAVAQVAVVGMPDERLGEVGCAFAVPARGRDDRPGRAHRLESRSPGELQGAPPHRGRRCAADQSVGEGAQARTPRPPGRHELRDRVTGA
jgi:acyl-CoA synthetase (AMP-forming)/AMP-acid ligase II